MRRAATTARRLERATALNGGIRASSDPTAATTLPEKSAPAQTSRAHAHGLRDIGTSSLLGVPQLSVAVMAKRDQYPRHRAGYVDESDR